MVSLTNRARVAASRFQQDQAGTISVDWAVMATVVAGLAIAAATSLGDSTNEFEDMVEVTLKDNLSNVQATGGGTRIVGDAGNGSSDGFEGEFGFAAVSPVASTTSSRVTCSELVSSCARSAETVSEQFLMTDGSVWMRQTTTYSDDGSQNIVWLDGTGRAAAEVPELPEDIPTMSF